MASIFGKSAEATGGNSRTSLGEGYTARPGQHIIQCPNCQTRFAVDYSLISGIDSPRFHCSRCDHVFGDRGFEQQSTHATTHTTNPKSSEPDPLSDRLKSRDLGTSSQNNAPWAPRTVDPTPPHNSGTPLAEAPLATWDEVEFEPPKPTIIRTFNSVPLEQTSTEHTTVPELPPVSPRSILWSANSGAQSDFTPAFSDPEPTPPQKEQLSLELPTQEPLIPNNPFLKSRGGKFDNDNGDHGSFAARGFGSLRDTLNSRASQTSLSEPRASERIPSQPPLMANYPEEEKLSLLDINEPEAGGSNFDRIRNAPSAPGEDSGNDRPVESDQERWEPIGSGDDGSGGPVAELHPSAVLPRGDLRLEKSGRWRSLLLLFIPVSISLLVLGAFAFHARTSPQDAASVVRFMFPDISIAAPADLFIKGTQLKRTPLDSGDSVLVITGTIINSSTTKTYTDIQVDGALFDGTGGLIKEERVAASPSLVHSRIRSLSLEMIQSVQTVPAKKAIQLKPGQKSEFAIALFGPEINKARFFSTRIYSVKSR